MHIIKADHLDHLDYMDHPDHPDHLDHPDHPAHPDQPDHLDHKKIYQEDKYRICIVYFVLYLLPMLEKEG